MKSLGWIFICLSLAATWCKAELPLEKLTLPAGFKISIWAKVPQARSLAMAPDGRVFVGNRDGSSVFVIQDGQTKVLAEGLNAPNGVAYRNGKLYVAELSRILEFNVATPLSLPLKASRILNQSFPSDFHHGWKFIRFGPDGKLYVPVGANCNVCNPQTQYGRIFRVDVDGNSVEEVAKGVRNTVGLDFHPVTHQLWFTENGRDLLGEDLPPDEINYVTTIGQHFGFPFCHGRNNIDPEYGGLGQCKESSSRALHA
jgi:glucose/arabinose dehydrogenase